MDHLALLSAMNYVLFLNSPSNRTQVLAESVRIIGRTPSQVLVKLKLFA